MHTDGAGRPTDELVAPPADGGIRSTLFQAYDLIDTLYGIIQDTNGECAQGTICENMAILQNAYDKCEELFHAFLGPEAAAATDCPEEPMGEAIYSGVLCDDDDSDSGLELVDDPFPTNVVTQGYRCLARTHTDSLFEPCDDSSDSGLDLVSEPDPPVVRRPVERSVVRASTDDILEPATNEVCEG
jgi:hypothetical protein